MIVRQFVASGLVCTPGRKKMLLIWHKKLQTWLQPGGHIDPNERPCEAALREVEEETGLRPRLTSAWVELRLSGGGTDELQLATPYCILEEHIPATPHEAAHKHIDLMYLMEHEEVELPAFAEYPGEAFRWVTREESRELTLFKSMRALIDRILV